MKKEKPAIKDVAKQDPKDNRVDSCAKCIHAKLC